MTNQPFSPRYNDVHVDGGFPVYADSKILAHPVSEKVVKYAKKKLDKASIPEFCEYQDKKESYDHSQLQLGDQLGQGSFSTVYEINSIQKDDWTTKNDDESNNKYVVKVLRQKLTTNPALLAACAADLVKEGIMMAELNHINIVGVHGWGYGGVTAYSSGRHDAFFIVLDRLEETLRDRIDYWQKKSKRNPYNVLFQYTRRQKQKQNQLLTERSKSILQLTKAVEYLQSKRILHRDLKPDNIGYDAQGNLKIFDFDVARHVPESAVPDETFLLTRRIGSPRYMAPEIARAEEYNLSADIYSLGLLCHELLTLEKPYDDVPSGQHDQFVFYNGVRPKVPSSWPKALSTIITRCWSDKLSDRPNIQEIQKTLFQDVFPSFLGTRKSQKVSPMKRPQLTRSLSSFLKRKNLPASVQAAA